jgi:hypothetical protein
MCTRFFARPLLFLAFLLAAFPSVPFAQDIHPRPRERMESDDARRVDEQRRSNEQRATRVEQVGRERDLTERPNQKSLDASELEAKLKQEKSSTITHSDLTNQTRAGIDQLAREKGFVEDQKKSGKYLDPVTNKERVRVDDGHVDKGTGRPYNNPNAAVPHVHGYAEDGSNIVHPETNDHHFPLKE